MKKLSARIYTNTFSKIVLALIFAALSVSIQYAELLKSSLTVKAGEPAPVTLRMPPAYFRITMLRNEFYYSPASSQGCQGLVAIGTVVEQGSECAGMVDAFEGSRRPISPFRVGGSFVMFFLIGFLLASYMSKDGMGRSRWLRSQISVFGLIILMAAISKTILLFTPFSFEALPVAMVPLLVSMLLGRRLSFAAALSSALVVSSLVNFNVQALFIFLVSGTASVTVANTFKKRFLKLLTSGVVISVVMLAAAILTTLLFSGTLDIYDDLGDHINFVNSIWLASIYGGIGSALISIMLLPFMGLAVGEATRARLVDLIELDHPLLKKLMEKAPSTWEHSRAMANLGEAAAHAINGNALLVRVGAYFHDVGKSLNPNYFIENQKGANPHDELRPHESALAIFSHVTEGVKLLRKSGVPEDVVAFAYTHHGTSVLEYFWRKNISDGNPDGFKEFDFSYPGHKPATRETAILMIVDAVEAAARTVDQPNKDKFQKLVQTIVFGKMTQGQFDESGLAMHDLRIVTITVVDTLVSMYHSRIKYPWQKDDEDSKIDNSQSVNQVQNEKKILTSESKPPPVSVRSTVQTGSHPVISERKSQLNSSVKDDTTGVTVAPVVQITASSTVDNSATVSQTGSTLTPPDPVTQPESSETTYTGPVPIDN